MSQTQNPRRLEPGKLIAATHNKGKIRELIDLLAPLGFELVPAGDLNLPEPEETGTTFEANAELKALASAQAANLPAISDDSGLSVDALDGDPGIYSARWSGPEKDFAVAMEKVNQALEDKGAVSRTARFVCALCVAWPDGHTETFRGEVEGELVWPIRGNKGFGYDPMFVANGETLTFGEMDPERKHAMSHRADAFNKLTRRLL
jgi:XTP/dITP diphosphohydrolase